MLIWVEEEIRVEGGVEVGLIIKMIICCIVGFFNDFKKLFVIVNILSFSYLNIDE